MNLEITTSKQTSNTIDINFNLLNPEDSVTLELLLLGTDVQFTAQARVKNITDIEIVDKLEEKKSIESQLELYFSPLMFVPFFLVASYIVELLPSYPKKLEAAELVTLGEHELLKMNSYMDLFNILKAKDGLSDNQKNNILEIALEITFPVSSESKQVFLDKLKKTTLFDRKKILKNIFIETIFIIILGFIPIIWLAFLLLH